MFKIALNNRKPYNYAFFCPVSKLHLTVSNPVGFAHEVTPAISRGLKSGTLVDVDGAIDLSAGKVKEAEQGQTTPPQNEPEPPQNEPESVPEPPQAPTEEDNAGKKKRGRKAAQNPVEETSNGLFEGIDQ